MPLIRYRTKDITTLRREKCACGRTLVTMEKITGRYDDMLIISGVNVFPSQIESTDHGFRRKWSPTTLSVSSRRATWTP